MSVIPTSEPKAFAWSYSQLTGFETCGLRYYHYNVAKDVTEPDDSGLREGNRLHKAFENRILHAEPLPFGMGMYENMLTKIVAAPGATLGEQKLAITSSFTPVTFFHKDVWFRTVIDAAKIDATTARIFDWKTGKVKKDTTQLQLMSAAVFHHDKRIERVKAALVFVAHGQLEREEFVRGDVTEIWSEILPRVKALEHARVTNTFPPKPSGLCKRYCAVRTCAYHGRGTS